MISFRPYVVYIYTSIEMDKSRFPYCLGLSFAEGANIFVDVIVANNDY
jgi:hypothetical protein